MSSKRFLPLLVLLSAQIAWTATPPCDGLIRSDVTNALFVRPKKNADFDTPEMRELARKFIDQNPVLLKRDGLKPRDIVITRIERSNKHPHYPEILIHYSRQDRIAGPYDYVSARTNGAAIFIEESYDYSQDSGSKQIFNVAVRTEKNETVIVNQTKAILDTLPDEITLSRVMTEGEHKIWTEGGKVENLRSQGAGEGSRSEISARTTFALNYFEFGGDKPVIVTIPKKVLQDLFNQGQLVINTYNDILDPYQGLSEDALTPFGLEVEVVVLSNKGREAIRPYMESPIEVPSEFPIRLVHKYRFNPPRNLSKAKKEEWLKKKVREAYEMEKQKGYQ